VVFVMVRKSRTLADVRKEEGGGMSKLVLEVHSCEFHYVGFLAE
jgi:hypothetical protein